MIKNYAQIDKNKLVTQVVVLADDKNQNWLEENIGGTWIETSETIRFNPAGVGMTYDSERDAFIPPQPFDSWVLNEETAQWEAPVEYPTDGKDYSWDEETISWVEMPQDGE